MNEKVIKEKVMLGEDFCWYREIECSETWAKCRLETKREWQREGRDNNYGIICPLCNGDLKVGETAYMVINNHKMFPNCTIHKSCANGNLLNATKILKSQYEQYQKMLEEFKAWL